MAVFYYSWVKDKMCKVTFLLLFPDTA